MKILICASEVVPFAKTGGLADVAAALPLALEQQGQDVVIAMPRYKCISDKRFNTKSLKKGISYSITGKNIKAYFIENEAYFNRDNLYGEKTGDYSDNLDRFSYFCARTLELMKEINFKPDILHCHDWQSCLAIIYLKTKYAKDPFFKDTKAILTIHNIGYQGLFPRGQFPQLGLDWSYFNIEQLEFYGQISLLKGGMVFADIINTVSPTYAKEIQTKDFGFGLEGVLNKRKKDVFGILNGIDYNIWNPQADKVIARAFSADDLNGKAVDKEDLQKLCKFPLRKDVALIGVISRLAEQKGFDLIAQDIEEICKMDLQLVLLGTGDMKYHLLLEGIAKRYPKVVSLYLKFDDELAHKIYAGSDIFLMPSRYEPCGLGQLIALRYGTIPLVFKTGGLADTVSKDNGFIFSQYNKKELLKTIKEAVKAFGNAKEWGGLVKKAMAYDFSWEGSAAKYIALYEKAKTKK